MRKRCHWQAPLSTEHQGCSPPPTWLGARADSHPSQRHIPRAASGATRFARQDRHQVVQAIATTTGEPSPPFRTTAGTSLRGSPSLLKGLSAWCQCTSLRGSPSLKGLSAWCQCTSLRGSPSKRPLGLVPARPLSPGAGAQVSPSSSLLGETTTAVCASWFERPWSPSCSPIGAAWLASAPSAICAGIPAAPASAAATRP